MNQHTASLLKKQTKDCFCHTLKQSGHIYPFTTMSLKFSLKTTIMNVAGPNSEGLTTMLDALINCSEPCSFVSNICCDLEVKQFTIKSPGIIGKSVWWGINSTPLLSHTQCWRSPLQSRGSPSSILALQTPLLQDTQRTCPATKPSGTYWVHHFL